MSKDTTAALAARAEALVRNRRSLDDQVRAFIADIRINDEVKRQLSYIQTELARGREAEDAKLLIARRTRLLAEAARARA